MIPVGLALLLLFVAVIAAFVVAHFRVLSSDEVSAVAQRRRRGEIRRYYLWDFNPVSVDSDFKARMPSAGGLFNLSVALRTLPSFAAGLLKSKKHEWILIAFETNGSADAMWLNKGRDRASVEPKLSHERIADLALERKATSVLVFHNHPNATLEPSPQDTVSAGVLADRLIRREVNLVEFVCGRGVFREYHRSVADEFMPLGPYVGTVDSENGRSKWGNLKLHCERIWG